MRAPQEFLRGYIEHAPTALALERSLECALFSTKELKHPILDIGSGDGLFALNCFEHKIDVGIDPSQIEIEASSKLDVYGELICCFGNEIPKEDKSFPSIISNSVLEHIEDLEPVIREARRLIADNGQMIVTVPIDEFEQASIFVRILQAMGMKSLAKTVRRKYNSFWRHYHAPSEGEWAKMFERNGFEVQSQILYCPKNTATFNDVMAPFALPSMIVKKTLNYWVLVPAWRKIVAPLLNCLAQPWCNVSDENGTNTLLFMTLTPRLEDEARRAD